MIALPMRREDAPLAVRTSTAARPRPASGAAPGAGTAPAPAPPAKGDGVADADEQALLEQQRAFDRMAALLAERQREANVIRDMAMEQLKRDEDVLKKWIALI